MNAVRRWLFDPVDPAPMAALRVACGLLTLGWTLSLLPDASAFLSDTGLTRGPVSGTAGWWTVDVSNGYVACALLAVASLALVLGWHARVAAWLVVAGLVILQRRDVYVLNSGDLLLRELAFYVALMPSGETWSLDARRREPQPRAPWGLRLLQVQLSCVYLFSVLAKLHGTSWQNGTAVGRAVQLEDLQRLVVPQWAATSVTVSALLTYGTLVAETFLVFGLWSRRTRWYAMAVGAAVHLGIEATLLIGWFSLSILACYLAFVPAETLRAAAARVRTAVHRPERMALPLPEELA